MERHKVDQPASGRDASTEMAAASAEFEQIIAGLWAAAGQINGKLTQDLRRRFTEELGAIIAFLGQPQDPEIQAMLDLFERARSPDVRSSSAQGGTPGATLPPARSTASTALDTSGETRECTEQMTRKEGVPPDKDIEALFDGLPSDPRRKLEAVPALYNAIRKAAAHKLQPAVAEVVEQAAKLEYNEMVPLSQVVNQALRAAQLGIRDPETGFPASLKPSRPRPSSPTRWLRLQDHWHGADGSRQSVRVDQLPPGSAIELMPTIAEHEQDRLIDSPKRPGR